MLLPPPRPCVVRVLNCWVARVKGPFLNIHRAPKPYGSGPARWLFKKRETYCIHNVLNLYARAYCIHNVLNLYAQSIQTVKTRFREASWLVLRVLCATQLIGSFKECEHLHCPCAATHFWTTPNAHGGGRQSRIVFFFQNRKQERLRCPGISPR